LDDKINQNGFTRFPNDILGAIVCTRKLSGNEIKVLLVIVRKTFGWGKKWDKIPYSQIVKMTGLPKDSIAKSFRKLVAKNIIEVENPNQKAWSLLRVNPNFTAWSGFSPAQSIITENGRTEKNIESEHLHDAVSSKIETKNKEYDNMHTSSQNNTHTEVYADMHTKEYAETHTSKERKERGKKEKSPEREKLGDTREKVNDTEKQQSFLPSRDEQIVNQYVEAWNKIATGRIPKVKFIPRGSARFKKALSRANNKFFRKNYKDVLKIITETPFLRGEVNEFKASFDWILKETNFIKILEGNYDGDGRSKAGKVNGSEKEKYHRGPDLKEAN